MKVDIIGTPQHTHTARRLAGHVIRVPAKLLAGLAIVMTLTVGADLAGAHGDTGEVTVTRAEQSGPDRIDLEVGIVYGDDGHIAADATVTATLLGPSGDSIGPVTLQRVDPNSSLFAGEVEVSGPGSWTVQIDSANPEGATSAEVDVLQDAAGDTTTTEAPASTEAPANTEAPATTEAPVDGAADEPLDAVADDGSTGGDDRWLLIGAAVAAVALVGIVTLALRRNGDGVPDDDTVA